MSVFINWMIWHDVVALLLSAEWVLFIFNHKTWIKCFYNMLLFKPPFFAHFGREKCKALIVMSVELRVLITVRGSERACWSSSMALWWSSASEPRWPRSAAVDLLLIVLALIVCCRRSAVAGSRDVMGNQLCAPWRKGYREDEHQWTPRKDSHLLRYVSKWFTAPFIYYRNSVTLLFLPFILALWSIRRTKVDIKFGLYLSSEWHSVSVCHVMQFNCLHVDGRMCVYIIYLYTQA